MISFCLVVTGVAFGLILRDAQLLVVYWKTRASHQFCNEVLEREKRLSEALRTECNERIEEITKSLKGDVALLACAVKNHEVRAKISDAIGFAVLKSDGPKLEQIRTRIKELLNTQLASEQKEGA